MKSYPYSICLDEFDTKIADGEKIADFLLKDSVVIELKTLKVDPTEKMHDFFHEVTKRPDFPGVYGQINFRKVVGLMPDSDDILKKFDNKAFRQVETVIRKANKQIKSTIKNLKLNKNVCGVLILINESAHFYEPDKLASYILELLNKKSGDELRFANIHHVILIQGTHKVSSEKSLLIPLYDLVNSNISKDEFAIKAEKVLADMIADFAVFNKMNFVPVHDLNHTLSVSPIKQIPKEKLDAQQKIEDFYRKNRYMENWSDEELKLFCSETLSIFYASLLKNNPLVMEHKKKLHFYKVVIEILEESRLRPFDLKKLDLFPEKYQKNSE